MLLPDKVKVIEVGPRDGLQSFSRWIDTDTKVAMIDLLSDAGFPVIEATSFARSTVVPHLKDAELVLARIRRRPGTVYRVLVPNARGAERAVASGLVDELLGLITVSKTYLRHNQNMTLDQAIDEGIRAFEIADAAGLGFTMALGVALWCPYEGRIPEDKTLRVIDRFRDAGIRRFYFAGSMGMEDPGQVHSLSAAAFARHPGIRVRLPRAQPLGLGRPTCSPPSRRAPRRSRARSAASAAGIAMPTNVGSVGNLPSEDLVRLLDAMGIDTGIDRRALPLRARSRRCWASSRAAIARAGRHPRRTAGSRGRDHPRPSG